jgi:dolichol-phosphate mannosyltransferase
MAYELRLNDPRVGIVELSRNFGHQVALTAGIDFADGDVVISMDGDGQHPPELIPELLKLYQQGFDLVLTQRRTPQPGFIKRVTTWLFYSIIRYLSDTPVLPNSSDFRLMSRQVVLGMRQIREQHRFLRGLIGWMGFRTTVLVFDPPPRIAGTSKYTIRKMLKLAVDAVFSFSTVPMRLSILIGFAFMLLALYQFGDALLLILRGEQNRLVPGWTSLITSVLFIGGVQLIILGIIGQYVGMAFQESKRRPLYFLRNPPCLPDTRTLHTREVQDYGVPYAR